MGKNNRGLWGVPWFNHLLGVLTELSIQLYACHDLLQSKVTKQSSKGKTCMGTVRGDQAQLPSIFSQWSRTEWACFPRQQVLTCDTCDMSTKAAHLSPGIQGVYWESVMQAPVAQHVQNSTLPEGKQVSSISHTVCKNSLGVHCQELVKTLQKSTFPDTSQGSAL